MAVGSDPIPFPQLLHWVTMTGAVCVPEGTV